MPWEVGHRIQRDGTSQPERVPRALIPENNPVDARQEEDLLLFLYRIADQFAYYNTRNELDGDWRAFFAEMADAEGNVTLESIRAFLGRVRQRRDNPAFLTILLAFLKLFRHVQADINTLTRKHLEFYFEKVLDFRRLPARPDEVHVLFELAPHVPHHRIAAGTALKAGKDALGRPLTYTTNREIIVNQTQLAAIKTVLVNDAGIYAAEVANSADGLGASLEGDSPKWATFGDPTMMQRSTVGFAIASPLLLLGEGERTIVLTLTLANATDIEETLFQRFTAQASGTAGWVDLRISGARKTGNQVVFTLIAGPETPAIVSYNPEILEGRLATTLPVLRLLLQPQSPPYGALKNATLTSASLSVTVSANAEQPGVRKLVVQNDNGRQDAGSSFQPFGAVPTTGSNFYIGSREVFSKPIGNLSLQLAWAGLPEDDKGFSDYYGAGSSDTAAGRDYHYPETYCGNGAYTVSLAVLQAGKWQDIGSGKRLFNESGKLNADQTLSFDGFALAASPDLPEIEGYDHSSQQGFIRLSLEHDFGHRLYPKLFAELSANPNVLAKEFPNAPYTPTLQAISLGYTAAQTIPLISGQFFHIQPFGTAAQKNQAAPYLLPQLPTAALYLGFTGMTTPQNLHLLFQIAEGSATIDDIIRDEDIQWDYLTADGWRNEPLKGSEIFINTAQGLQKSGIVACSIGSDASTDCPLLPKGYHWLRAKIDKDPAGAARTIAIHTQAVTAKFQDNHNDPAHLLVPLPADSVSGLVQREQAIRSVKQPYASFDGASAEQAHPFYARVSERQRHKQRAITLWDIERLVLQQFPQLYEVKVIPHAGLDGEGCYSEFRPGQLTVVLVPKLRNQNALNPLQPMVSNALREAVKRYLLPMTASFAGQNENALQVINPRYEPLQVSCSVGFREDYDGGFYAEELNKALQRYLSPWAFEEGPDIRFRNRIYKSQLLAFVEELPYVDYVTDFELRQDNAGPGVDEMSLEVDFIVRDDDFGQAVESAIPSTAASILISAEQHNINVLQPDTYPCAEPELCPGGIGCWRVEDNLIVS